MTNENQVAWDEVNLPNEPVTEEDISGAESMSRAAPGKYLCVCVESNAMKRQGEGYGYISANLKWQILKTYEIRGEAIPAEDQDKYEGIIWDDVRMEHAEEKEGWRKRRILIAKRTGLIDSTSDEITKEMWAKGIIGKQAVLTTEDREYDDQKTGQKKVVKGVVTFSGYDYVPKEDQMSDSFDDI